MTKDLDRQAVKAWLDDQQAAAVRIARERWEKLPMLRPEESLQEYLDLWRCAFQKSMAPSALALAMRKAVAKLGKGRRYGVA
ncbi:MAG: hypothetical protein H5T68_03735 [Chloroflexi bacterium]|nr:hypothetical protein [Chloroflexota bacterium]